MNRPLKGTIEFRIEIGKFISVPRIMEAVEGLIKFHEDRIEELIKELGFLEWDTWDTFRFIIEIEKEYESIMAIEHWFEDCLPL